MGIDDWTDAGGKKSLIKRIEKALSNLPAEFPNDQGTACGAFGRPWLFEHGGLGHLLHYNLAGHPCPKVLVFRRRTSMPSPGGSAPASTT